MKAVDVPRQPGDDLNVRRILACIVAALVLFAPVIARGQDLPRSRDPLHVYLITFGPGADPWEKFGHDCIAFKDDDDDPDAAVAYNWGVFSFGQGFTGYVTFGWHFLQGKLLYSMQKCPAEEMLQDYNAAGRSILIQELRLTRLQKFSLRQKLRNNDTEANRYYLYDYFRKNCTTMARDALDQEINGRIAAGLKGMPTANTYRSQDRRTTADTLWLYVFLDCSLGHYVDRPLSAWDDCFLPGGLAKYITPIKVPDAEGKLQPLVISQEQYATGKFAERDAPPAAYFYGFLAGGIGIGGLFCLLAIGESRFRFLRWVFTLGVMVWSTVVGMLGALITFALFTNHEAAKWNENWFQGNPLSLLLIVLAPMAFRWPKLALRVAIIVFALSGFNLIAKITPWFWQVNGTMIAVALPIHAGIGWGMYRLTSRPKPPTAPVETPNTEEVDAA
jgi:hypothetical protein